ncbi:MAG: hypothetical protein JO227_02885, partial [Acetobacteraceae bacterium]|nr:hypothetical protein [Acetobacteraceae bacterium]
MTHAFATVAIPFAEARQEEVEAVLRAMGAPPNEAVRAAVDETKLIHFMSINVIPQTRPGKAHLLIEVSADGSVQEALRAVAKALGNQLAQVLELMGRGNHFGRNPDALARLLIRHHRSIGQSWFARAVGLPFDGTPGMSVQRLGKERELAAHVSRMG